MVFPPPDNYSNISPPSDNYSNIYYFITSVPIILQDLDTNITPEKYVLRSQLLDLKAVLQDVIKGKGQDLGHEMTSDIPSKPDQPMNNKETRRGISVVGKELVFLMKSRNVEKISRRAYRPTSFYDHQEDNAICPLCHYLVTF